MVDVLAISARTPLGFGEAGWSVGAIGAAAATAIARDDRLVAAGLKKPFAARSAIAALAGEDRATALLREVVAPLEAFVRDRRIGLAIGSSSGAMETAERFFRARAEGEPFEALARSATYHAPHRALVDRLRSLGATIARETHVLTACAASTIAIGLACRWIEAGACDLAIAGGYDALTTFVAAGFEALGATTAHPPPRPMRVGRDGMSLGEGAALFVLARDARAFEATPLAKIVGFGAAGDAVHLTAPDREGRGLARAAIRALGDARTDASSIALVSLHGTATPFNDPMESKAIDHALGGRLLVHAPKASIGHTLGAAGAIETALAIDCVRRGVAPATAGSGDVDPAITHLSLATNEAREIAYALKLSAAFGGADAALVIARADRESPEKTRESVSIEEVATASIDGAIDAAAAAEITGLPRERLARMDGLCHLALAATAKLASHVGREALAGAGVVFGTALATIDVNATYDEGLRTRGAAHAEGRRFAYTTPNAAAGECAIAFGLTGPNVAVGRGLEAAIEADEIARDFLRAGDAEAMVVIDADASGPAAIDLARSLGADVRFGARARLLRRK